MRLGAAASYTPLRELNITQRHRPEGICKRTTSSNCQFCMGQIYLVTDLCLLPSMLTLPHEVCRTFTSVEEESYGPSGAGLYDAASNHEPLCALLSLPPQLKPGGATSKEEELHKVHINHKIHSRKEMFPWPGLGLKQGMSPHYYSCKVRWNGPENQPPKAQGWPWAVLKT